MVKIQRSWPLILLDPIGHLKRINMNGKYHSLGLIITGRFEIIF